MNGKSVPRRHSRKPAHWTSRLCGEGGFSLAEVMVAFLILGVSVLPMVGMFDSSFKVTRMAYEKNASQQCGNYFLESVRNIPFYDAHNYDEIGTGVKKDVDDYYWGERARVGGSLDNSWKEEHAVVMKDFGAEPYPDLQVKVNMGYVDHARLGTGTPLTEAMATMHRDWVPYPISTSQVGKDKPVDQNGIEINVMVYEVTVYESGSSAPVYRVSSVYSSPKVSANLYVNKVVNVSVDATKRGQHINDSGTPEDPSDDYCDSAPHTKSQIDVRIYGEGFSDNRTGGNWDMRATLVRLDDADVQVSITDIRVNPLGLDEIDGRISLDSGGVASPWSPRKKPGSWDIIISELSVASAKQGVFVVEYPPPRVTDFLDKDGAGDKVGSAASKSEVIRVWGDLMVKPSAVTGAVLQLLRDSDANGVPDDDNGDGVPDENINGTNTEIVVPGGSDGYATGLQVRASFDFTGHTATTYLLRVVNCVSASAPGVGEGFLGNTYHIASGHYRINLFPPQPSEIYVEGSEPHRHFIYDERSYGYNLRVKGENLVEGMTARIGRGPVPNGSVAVAAKQVNLIDSENAIAVFDPIDIPNGHRDFTDWWVYVEAPGGLSGYLENAFSIRTPRPIIYQLAYRNGPGGFYHNYHSIGARIEGECFEDSGYRILYESGNPGGGAPVTTYEVGVADGGMAKSLAGTQVFEFQLNLIHVAAGNRRLWVESPTGVTDDGYTDHITGYSYSARVPVVAAAAQLDSQASGAVTITNRWQDWWFYWGWKNVWKGPESNTENASTRAMAQRTNRAWFFLDNREEPGYATFTLRGQGFKDPNVGTTKVDLYQDGRSGDFSAVYNANDRANKFVTLVTVEWKMPESSGDRGIRLDNTNTYAGRYRLDQWFDNN